MTDLIPFLNLLALAALLASAAIGLATIGLAAIGLGVAPVTAPGTGVTTGSGGRDALPAATPPLAGRLVMPLLATACAALLGGLVGRSVLVGHAPWSNLHEFSLALATATLVAYLLTGRAFHITGLAPLVALLAAGMVGFGLAIDDRVDPLVPALQQPLLLTVHVGAAVAAYALAGIAFVAAAVEIAQRAAGDAIRGLPGGAAMRSFGHRAVVIGFPILTLAIALGSVWANLAWRSYWSNDPKELAAAATWLVFAAYLHVASRRDRWGTMAPWLIVAGFGAVLFTYVGAGLFIVGEHSYGTP